MGLCDSYEEEIPASPSDVVIPPSGKPLFDDPKYMTTDQAKQQVSMTNTYVKNCVNSCSNNYWDNYQGD